MTAAMPAPIKARRVRFDWETTPIHWVPGDAQTTHTMNVLHLLLPAGEKWFVDVYRNALPLITNEQLRDQVKGFMGQEAVHSRAHAVVLEHLAAQGIDATPFTRLVEWLFFTVGADEPFGRKVPTRLQRLWLVQRLSIIAAIEHFTAVLGIWVVEQSQGLEAAGADPTMLDLLRWHGAEEVEHRSVAFDVYQHVSGAYPRRVASMLGAAIGMTLVWVLGLRFFLRTDPTRPGKATYRSFIRAGRRGTLPTFRSIMRTIPDYLRRSHHPSQTGSTELALAYLASSPAATAATKAG
jgi:predicted metal-dependent hydrolase